MRSVLRLGCAGVALVLLAACSGESGPAPSELADGSSARPPPVSLEGIDGPAVATRHRTRVSRSAALCLDTLGAAIGGDLVERIGASGTSVTYVDAGGRRAHACDSVGSEWCGRAFGRLVRGRLRDPRLSLTCLDANDRVLAFAWVQPGVEVRYVVVEQPGYAEVYDVGRRLPVRVTSRDVDVTTSSAHFAVTEHAATGRRLRAYVLETRVAG